MDDDKLSGWAGWALAAYMGIGAAMMVGALWPVIAAIGIYLAAHKVEISVEVIMVVVKAVKQGKDPVEAIKEAGVEGIAGAVLLAALRVIGISDKE